MRDKAKTLAAVDEEIERCWKELDSRGYRGSVQELSDLLELRELLVRFNQKKPPKKPVRPHQRGI